MLQHPSPNCGSRRDGARPDIVVIHYTAMTTAADALARLCDPMAEVSAHYLICEQGR
ncbi:MAG: N-acetylmuramoyl-L-alanine amidase, partial [Paracoccaceae bacterium]|nr:N-acetylmuramoyl-L-alanine amidase [Paracoccaceae bacterium]